jgi:hypothetical protein
VLRTASAKQWHTAEFPESRKVIEDSPWERAGMSTFENDRYRWRETYFVLFPAERRPPLATVEKALAALSKRYLLSDPTHDEHAMFESLTLASPDDFAAMDICLTTGEEVLEQGAELAEELSSSLEPSQRPVLKKIKSYDGRFDVLHFEQIADVPEEGEEGEDLLDPSALLAVLAALAKITGGIAVDPQSGTILSESF